MVIRLSPVGQIEASDDGRARLIAQLDATGIDARWSEAEHGFIVGVRGIRDVGRREAKLVQELKSYGRITELIATVGPKCPRAEFFESLGKMPDVSYLGMAFVSDERVLLGALKACPNVLGCELLDVSFRLKAIPALVKCKTLICDMQFDDAALQSLLKMKRLETLHIRLAEGATVSGVTRLKEISTLIDLVLTEPPPRKPDPAFRGEVIREMEPTVKVVFAP